MQSLQLFLFYVIITYSQLTDGNLRITDEGYSFSYSIDDISSGVKTNTWEEKIGNFVRGGYSLVEPGGKLRIVEYNVNGQRGFRAKISYKKSTNFNVSSSASIGIRANLSSFHHRTPIRLMEPVSLITPDLFKPKYFNLHDFKRKRFFF